MIIFRTNGAWGAGKGSNLTAVEVDGNFYDPEQRLSVIEALPPAAAGISHFSIVDDQLTVHMDDSTTRGPYELPVFVPVFRGEWQPSTPYSRGDQFTENGSF